MIVMEEVPVHTRLRERRNLVSLFMVTTLLSLALQETITPVRSVMRADGINVASTALFVVFFLTMFRFFVGNVLHLQSPELTSETSGFRWVFDLFVIVAECMIMIFMAGVVTLPENAQARFGFFDLLLLLLIVDVSWIVVMSGLAAITRLPVPRAMKDALGRRIIPYRWALLNSALAAYVMVSGFLDEGHVFTNSQLTIFIAANAAAFLLDVLVFDYEDLL
jgi:hypothetical protein